MSRRVRKRILVVDDDVDVAEPLSIVLSRHHDVDLAANGAEAVTRIGRAHYDAIVLDLVMPVMDGAAFKAYLDEHGIAVPVLLVSGSTDLDERAKQMGVADHLAKPLDASVLQDRLAALFDRAAARAAGSSSGALAAPPLAAHSGTSR